MAEVASSIALIVVEAVRDKALLSQQLSFSEDISQFGLFHKLCNGDAATDCQGNGDDCQENLALVEL